MTLEVREGRASDFDFLTAAEVTQRKNRDSFKVWCGLARAIHQSPPEGSGKLAEILQGFPAWVTAHKEELKRVKELFLNTLELASLPNEIASLEDLRILHLEDNQFEEIPVQLTNVVRLGCLYMENNRITSLSSEISKMGNLQYLFLQENHLTDLPAEIQQLPLKVVRLDHNRFRTIPPQLRKKTWKATFWGNPCNFRSGHFARSTELATLGSLGVTLLSPARPSHPKG